MQVAGVQKEDSSAGRQGVACRSAASGVRGSVRGVPGAGRPFQPGFDARRNLQPPPARPPVDPTARTLARQRRKETVAALARLRDTAEDESIRLEAAKVLLAYSDGEPGSANIPTAEESSAGEADAIAEALRGLTQELPPAVEGALDETARRGGDAGDSGEGNGGAA